MRSGSLLFLLASMALAGCGGHAADREIALATIDSPDAPFVAGPRQSYAAQLLHGATRQGLVGYNADGETVPGLAESWIVTDEGRSYIFRLRTIHWPDGTALTARQVRRALRRAIAAQRGTALGLDLAKIDDIRAMTGRVIEFRLRSPMPEFLHLLAQPELGVEREGAGLGPLDATRDGPVVHFTAARPPEPGMEDEPRERVRPLTLRALPAAKAIAAFRAGRLDALFDGRIGDWPAEDTGPLSRGTVRLEPALGLFGLRFMNTDGVLAQPRLREALSMAIDRDDLLTAFNIGGFTPTARIVPTALADPRAVPPQRWADLSLDQRRAEAARRIAAWRPAHGAAPGLTIDLPRGPGGQQLLGTLTRDFARIGVELRRVRPGASADLGWVDERARYDAPRWYLDQFNCALGAAVCSPQADALVAQSLTEQDAQARRDLLARAEEAMLDAEVFIPFGAPVRWSMVRGTLQGFAVNRWSFHPLWPIASVPIS